MQRTLLLFAALLTAALSTAQPTGPMISEVVEGSGNNRAIEIFNPTDAAISLGDYQLSVFLNGAQVASATLQLDNVSLAAGDTWVVVNNDSVVPPDAALLAAADQLDTGFTSVTYFTGNDALLLSNTSGSYFDVFGVIGQDPGLGWDNADSVVTSNHTLVRRPEVLQGIQSNPDTAQNFDWDHTQWIVLPENTFDSLGSHTYDNALWYGVAPIIGELAAWPNPTTGGLLNIRASQPISRVSCHSLTGAQVNATVTGLNTLRTTLQINALPTQLLFVRVFTADGAVQTFKIKHVGT